MQIEYWTADRVKPYPQNARTHPPEQVAAIAKQMKAVGVMKPIVVDERNQILAGHGAFMAMQQLGLNRREGWAMRSNWTPSTWMLGSDAGRI